LAGFGLVGLLLGLLSLSIGCPKEPNEPTAPVAAAAAKKRLVFGITSEPDTLCPLVADSAVGQELSAFVARDLVLSDPSWNTVPDLAAALPTTDHDAEGRPVAHWKLRPDARWQDGTPVSAKDLMLAWRVQTDPARQTVAGRDVAEQMFAFAATDGGVDVTWKKPVTFWADPRTHRPLPAHLLDSQLVDDKGNLRPLKDLPFCRAPLSNGPCVLTEWAAGQHLVFARNDAARPRALLDALVVRIVPSSTALSAGLLSGEIDATFPNAGLSPVEARAFVAAHADRFELVSTPGQVWTHIDFNLDHAWLADRRVREAIALAIPRQRIFDAISGGLYQLSETYLPPQHWGHATVAPIPFDSVRAQQLLDEAGWRRPADGGTRKNKSGQPLALKLAAASGLKETEEMLTLVKQALAEVGVDVTIELSPFKVFNGALAKERARRELTFFAWVFDQGTFGGSMWRSDKIPTADSGLKGQNFPGYRNDTVTQLLKDIDDSVDPALRKEKLAQVQQQLRADLPALPMYFRPAVIVARRGVSGPKPTGTMTPLAWNAHTWDVR
jgi:peptide/nickel transport system substrate-binding protein